jgi:nucleoside-diphosphate-sugar epimerase
MTDQTPWTLTHTSDFAIGLIGLLGNKAAIGESFHITGDEVHTWNQIYAEISIALGVDIPELVKVPTDFICEVAPEYTGTLKGDKSHPGVFDNSRIKRARTGIPKRERCLSEGLRESVEWLRVHPEAPESEARIGSGHRPGDPGVEELSRAQVGVVPGGPTRGNRR